MLLRRLCDLIDGKLKDNFIYIMIYLLPLVVGIGLRSLDGELGELDWLIRGLGEFKGFEKTKADCLLR